MKDKKVNANSDEFFDTKELTSDNIDGVAGGAGGYNSAGEWDGCCPLCGEKMTIIRTDKRQHIAVHYYRCEGCGWSKKTWHDDRRIQKV